MTDGRRDLLHDPRYLRGSRLCRSGSASLARLRSKLNRVAGNSDGIHRSFSGVPQLCLARLSSWASPSSIVALNDLEPALLPRARPRPRYGAQESASRPQPALTTSRGSLNRPAGRVSGRMVLGSCDGNENYENDRSSPRRALVLPRFPLPTFPFPAGCWWFAGQSEIRSRMQLLILYSCGLPSVIQITAGRDITHLACACACRRAPYHIRRPICAVDERPVYAMAKYFPEEPSLVGPAEAQLQR